MEPVCTDNQEVPRLEGHNIRNDQSVSQGPNIAASRPGNTEQLERERVKQRQGGPNVGTIPNYLLERERQRQGVRDVAPNSSYLSEKEERQKLQRARQKRLETIKTDHELMQLRGIEAVKNYKK